ncbi:hypothetical protein BC940DRAFT_15741 [Gongronella butleri]|nr:hypothetical protein BC940DRAFT_15741 [Gongronella butleri]
MAQGGLTTAGLILRPNFRWPMQSQTSIPSSSASTSPASTPSACTSTLSQKARVAFPSSTPVPSAFSLLEVTTRPQTRFCFPFILPSAWSSPLKNSCIAFSANLQQPIGQSPVTHEQAPCLMSPWPESWTQNQVHRATISANAARQRHLFKHGSTDKKKERRVPLSRQVGRENAPIMLPSSPWIRRTSLFFKVVHPWSCPLKAHCTSWRTS